MGTVRTRKLVPDEWELFRDMRLRALLDAPDAFGATYATSATMDERAWRGWLTGDGWDATLASFVVEDDAAPVAIATCAVFHAEPDVADLFSMWVAPPARGKGAGRRLVEAAVDHARDRSCDRVILRVTVGNDAAAALYVSCGFVGTDTPPQPLREGSNVLTTEMRLPLRDVDDRTLPSRPRPSRRRERPDRAPRGPTS